MMKSYIWLETSDGSIQQVEQEVAMFCPMICHQVLQKGAGSSKNSAISLPHKVNPPMLSLIFDYCRFHQLPGRSNKVGSLTHCLSTGDQNNNQSFLFIDRVCNLLFRNVKFMMRNSCGWIQSGYAS